MRKSVLNISIVNNDIAEQFQTTIKIQQTGVPCNISSYENVDDLFNFLDGNTSPQSNPPDIVLLDGNALRTDRDSIIESLKRMAEFGHSTRIYLLLSYYRPGNVLAGGTEHVHGFFSKPLSTEDAVHLLLGEKLVSP